MLKVWYSRMGICKSASALVTKAGKGVGVGVGTGVGIGVGVGGIGVGVSLGLGLGVGAGVGVGSMVGGRVGSGVGAGVGIGDGVGRYVGLAVGFGVGALVGSGVWDASTGITLTAGAGEAQAASIDRSIAAMSVITGAFCFIKSSAFYRKFCLLGYAKAVTPHNFYRS